MNTTNQFRHDLHFNCVSTAMATPAYWHSVIRWSHTTLESAQSFRFLGFVCCDSKFHSNDGEAWLSGNILSHRNWTERIARSHLSIRKLQLHNFILNQFFSEKNYFFLFLHRLSSNGFGHKQTTLLSHNRNSMKAPNETDCISGVTERKRETMRTSSQHTQKSSSNEMALEMLTGSVHCMTRRVTSSRLKWNVEDMDYASANGRRSPSPIKYFLCEFYDIFWPLCIMIWVRDSWHCVCIFDFYISLTLFSFDYRFTIRTNFVWFCMMRLHTYYTNFWLHGALQFNALLNRKRKKNECSPYTCLCAVCLSNEHWLCVHQTYFMGSIVCTKHYR